MPDLRALAVQVGTANAYVGTVDHHTDGDTIAVKLLDPVISIPVVVSVRVAGINCPDRGEPGWAEVNAAFAAWLPAGRVVTLTGLHADKYAGRVDASLATADGTDVAGWLLGQGFAVRWDGRGARPLVPWPPPL